MGLTTDWSPREEKKSKSEDGLIKSYMKNTEKKDFLKVSRTSVTCEMVLSYSRRRERILGQKKIFTEIIVNYVPTLVKSPTHKEFQ